MSKETLLYSSSADVDTAPSKTILSVGTDPICMTQRASLLLRSGYMVVSAPSIQEAVRLFPIIAFDLMLLCDSLSRKERNRLACLIRASGSPIPIISVGERHEKTDLFSSVTVDYDDPRQLLAVVNRALFKNHKTIEKSVPRYIHSHYQRTATGAIGIAKSLARSSP